MLTILAIYYYTGLIKTISGYYKGTDMNDAFMTIKYKGLEHFSYALYHHCYCYDYHRHINMTFIISMMIILLFQVGMYYII